MANTLKILYWLRKKKTNKTGLCPLIIRISYQRMKTERATGFYIDPKNWNTILRDDFCITYRITLSAFTFVLNFPYAKFKHLFNVVSQGW